MRRPRTFGIHTVSIELGGLVYKKQYSRPGPELARAWKARQRKHFKFPHLYPRRERVRSVPLSEVFRLMGDDQWYSGATKANGKAVVEILGQRPVHRIGVAGVASFIAELERQGDGPGTINRKLASLSLMFEFARSRRWVTGTPKIVRIPTTKAAPCLVSLGELQDAIAVLNGSHTASSDRVGGRTKGGET